MEKKRAKIIVVGSINMDLVVKSEHIPVAGETVTGQEFVMIPGGKGANQAVAAARLGAHVEMVGCVGGDPFGKQMLEQLGNEGVGTTYVTTDPQQTTGVALIQVQDGENRITVVPGANAQVTPAHVDEAQEVFVGADMLLVQLEIPQETVLRAVQLAKRHGVKVILNPAPAAVLPDEIWPYVDLVTPNETEAVILTSGQVGETGADSQTIMNNLRSLTNTDVIITQGEKGVAYHLNGAAGSYPAYRVNVVDTTAAGDSFNAALAVWHGEGCTLEQAIAFAAKVGALTVSRFGAQTSLPTRQEVEEFEGQLNK
ncbi:ribokinase [Paenibacillus roseipurpureus]|uniref:Ribokinase n=1 Tax=Paenibacillus roseopurpureus TaxID=2918901 RepID=A0AA96RLI5_9BACL|nr:ribokinase [Paenibacillus sp. MBLB1832]WNR45426.1 ribokinase [Paenibacillus sp. MBLB1832]